MNSPHEPDLKAAMQRLSDVAGPADLADAALRGAKRMRRVRGALTTLAAVAAVGGMSLPFTIQEKPPAVSPGFAAPSKPAAPPSSLGGCQAAPMVNPTTKEVANEHWPKYVATVLSLLPDRSDYVVQNTHDLCNWGEPGTSNAYTVINLGHGREHGHLTVNLYVYENQWVPNSCADLNATAPKSGMRVLFCQEGVNAQPMLYGTAYSDTTVTVGAVYADHRAVVMERNDKEAVAVISVDDLKVVVADQDLLNLIPTADGPLPTSSAKPGVEASTPPKR
ncbi:hypothetical protein [Catellatospora sichuanensis]|uniref:hypothetical protein n=1 Tax=Catellatospora sichuanensis TaxID=1969805 RepID=UPI001183D6C1|nr:hypothetical protein [Catellatospora sichuanensis]